MMAENGGGGISALTGLVALLGHPVLHSLSPRMQNAAFRALGSDKVYLAFDVPPERLAAAVHGLLALGAGGANITVPHKEAIIPLLQGVDPLAARVGAVNVVVAEQGGFMGYNTDIYGFLMSLERTWGRSPAGARCLVLGAGGVARAITAGLIMGSAAEVLVHNRTAQRADALCLAAEAWGATPCRTVTAQELKEAAREADLIVNATSAGLHESVKDMGVPVDILSRKHMVFDVAYGPRPSHFLRGAQKRGAATADGTEMLVQQAALSFELWTGVPAPVELMRQEAKRV